MGEFKHRFHVKVNEDILAKAYNEYRCKIDAIKAREKKIQEIMKEYKEEKGMIITEEMAAKEAEKFKDSFKRTVFFDKSRDKEELKNLLVEELQNLIRNKCRDGKKITPDGEKILKGYSSLIDLFNMKSNKINTQIAYPIREMIEQSKERDYWGDPLVEDDKNFLTNVDEKNDENDFNKLFEKKVKEAMEEKAKG